MPCSVLPLPLTADCVMAPHDPRPNPKRDIVPHYSHPRRELMACQHGAMEKAGC